MASVRDSLSHKLKGFLFQITNHTEHSAADHMASHRHKTTVQNHTHTRPDSCARWNVGPVEFLVVKVSRHSWVRWDGPGRFGL